MMIEEMLKQTGFDDVSSLVNYVLCQIEERIGDRNLYISQKGGIAICAVTGTKKVWRLSSFLLLALGIPRLLLPSVAKATGITDIDKKIGELITEKSDGVFLYQKGNENKLIVKNIKTGENIDITAFLQKV